MKPVCRNIKTNDLYIYEGGLRFTNIRTGATGEIEAHLARENLKINIDATQLIHQYPMIETLIKTLNLKIQHESPG